MELVRRADAGTGMWRRMTGCMTDGTIGASGTAARRPVAAPVRGRLAVLNKFGAVDADDDALPVDSATGRCDDVLSHVVMLESHGDDVSGHVASVDEEYFRGGLVTVRAVAEWLGKLAVWAEPGGGGQGRAVSTSRSVCRGGRGVIKRRQWCL